MLCMDFFKRKSNKVSCLTLKQFLGGTPLEKDDLIDDAHFSVTSCKQNNHFASWENAQATLCCECLELRRNMFCRIAHTLCADCIIPNKPTATAAQQKWLIYEVYDIENGVLRRFQLPLPAFLGRTKNATHQTNIWMLCMCTLRLCRSRPTQCSPKLYTDFPQHRRKRTLSHTHTLKPFYLYKIFFMAWQRCGLIFS